MKPSELMKVLGRPGSAERLRNETLLGPEYEALVKNAISLMANREVKAEEFKGAGRFASNSTIAQLTRVPLKYAKSFVTKTISAIFYTSEPMQRLLTNKVFGPKETAALASYVIASEPFLKRVYELTGNNEDMAHEIVRDAKSSIDRYVTQDIRQTAEENQLDEMMNFLRTKQGKVKIEAQP